MLVLGANDDHFFGELFLSRQILFEEIHDILAKNSVGIKTNIPTLLLNKQGYQLNDLNVNEDFKISLAYMVDPGPEGDS